MRSIYSAENLFDAQLVKDALEAAGVPAFITGSALTGAVGELPVSGLIDVQVPDCAWECAHPIVDEIAGWLAEKPVASNFQDDPDGVLPTPA